MTDNRLSLFGLDVRCHLRTLTGKRKRVLEEKENWMLLPNTSSSRPHFSGQRLAPSDAIREGVPLSAWREYGYWARPTIGGVEVRNSDSTHCSVTFNPGNREELTLVHGFVCRSAARPRVTGCGRRRGVQKFERGGGLTTSRELGTRALSPVTTA